MREKYNHMIATKHCQNIKIFPMTLEMYDLSCPNFVQSRVINVTLLRASGGSNSFQRAPAV